MRQNLAHLEVGKRVFLGIVKFVPQLLCRGIVEKLGLELIPGAGQGAPRRAHGPGDHAQEMETARHLPSSQVSRTGAAPGVAGEPRSRLADAAGHPQHHLLFHSRFGGGEFRGEPGVIFQYLFDKGLEGLFCAGMLGGQVLPPVHPLLHEFPVVEPFGQDDPRHGQQYRRLRAGVGGHPVVGMAGRVGKAGVHHRHFRASVQPLHDALGVWIEVMSGLQVGTDQQDEASAGVIGRGPVDALPEGIPQARSGGANVGVAVVPVYPPGPQDALHVSLMTGPPHVIDHLVAAVFLDGLADFCRDILQHLFPANALPLPRPARALAAQGIQDAFRVVDLVDGGRALGAVPAP